MTETGDERTTSVLSSMYQAERADLMTLNGSQTTLVGVLVTYFGIAVAAFTVVGGSEAVHQVAALAALPLWGLMIYAAFLAPISVKLSTSTQLLETKLREQIDMSPRLARNIGVTAANSNPTFPGAALATGVMVVIYAVMAVTVIAFTAGGLYVTLKSRSFIIFWLAAIVYLLLLLFTAATWFVGYQNFMSEGAKSRALKEKEAVIFNLKFWRWAKELRDLRKA